MTTPGPAEGLVLFVASAPGLEPHLVAELRALGFDAPRGVAGGAEIETDLAGCYRVLLGCRLGLSVRLRLAEFRTTHFAHFEKQLEKQPWRRYLPEGALVRARATAKRSRLYHTGGLEERLSRVVSKAVGAPISEEPHEASEDDGRFAVHVRMEHDVCSLSLDLCGPALHRRGYRLQTGKAPLREDLAAALLHVAGYDGSQTLVDPMCGSGTLLIEAARLASGLPAGGDRSFLVERMGVHDRACMDAVRAQWTRPASAGAPCLGSDRDAGAVAAATANAERARVESAVTLVRAPLSACEPPSLPSGGAGLIVTNPPYGRRIGHRGALRDLYAALGRLRQRAGTGYRLALVTSEPSLAHATGLALEPVLLTESGGTKVRFYIESCER